MAEAEKNDKSKNRGVRCAHGGSGQCHVCSAAGYPNSVGRVYIISTFLPISDFSLRNSSWSLGGRDRRNCWQPLHGRNQDSVCDRRHRHFRRQRRIIRQESQTNFCGFARLAGSSTIYSSDRLCLVHTFRRRVLCNCLGVCRIHNDKSSVASPSVCRTCRGHYLLLKTSWNLIIERADNGVAWENIVSMLKPYSTPAYRLASSTNY